MTKRIHTTLELKLMAQLGELERERDILRAELRRVSGRVPFEKALKLDRRIAPKVLPIGPVAADRRLMEIAQAMLDEGPDEKDLN